jgi:PEP-CTERM motif
VKTIALLPLALIALSASPARAGIGIGHLQISGTPSLSSPGSVAFGADGALALFGPADTVLESDGPNAGLSFPITQGSILFALGPVEGGSASTVFDYGAGGSLSVSGALPGMSGPQSLLTGSFLPTEVVPLFGGGFALDGATFVGVIHSPGLVGQFGLPLELGYLGNVFAVFSGSPGGPNTLVGVEVQIDVFFATVPEPSSVGLVAAGLACVIGRSAWGRMRRRP